MLLSLAVFEIQLVSIFKLFRNCNPTAVCATATNLCVGKRLKNISAVNGTYMCYGGASMALICTS